MALDHNWHYLITGWGLWYLFELLGLVLLPALMFAVAVRERNLKLIRWAATLAIIGVVMNRMNVSLIAFNWHLPIHQRYFPGLMEIITSVFIVTLGVTAYRLIVTYMPILNEHPDYRGQTN